MSIFASLSFPLCNIWSAGAIFSNDTAKIGTFNMHVAVESLFFIGSQLVALSRAPVGKIGVWHSMTQHWQIQDVTPVSSYDTAGSLLLLGCSNGSICYIGHIHFITVSLYLDC